MRLRRKKWAPSMIEAHPDVALTEGKEAELLPFDGLEIGSGRGKFLLEMAKKNPSRRFLGLEMNYNAFSLAVKRAANDPDAPKNFAFLNVPMERVMETLKDDSISDIYLNFSDPWPKKKQYKRRLTYPTRLYEYYRVLKKGGTVRFKTDNEALYRDSVHYFKAFGQFEIRFEGVYETDDPDDVCTEFEARFRAQGVPIYRIVAVKTTDRKLEKPKGRNGLMDMPEVKLKAEGKISRLTDKTFHLDERFGKAGDWFYTANYFLKTRKIVTEHLANQTAMLQFFQREDDVMACGLDEVLALIQKFAVHPEALKILALNDGDVIKAEEPVLKIEGKYEDFGFLESAIDGILSRRSSVATNAMRVIRVANGKPILDMADRQDDPYTQAGDGYAAYVAGLRLFSTLAQGSWVGLKAGGTMPHALIELCQGDILKAADCYLETYPDKPVTALIDYHNDVVNDSVALAKHLGKKLGCVRIDTSKALMDHWFDDPKRRDHIHVSDLEGVNVYQVKALREELDRNGFPWVKICVSSGFNDKKIAAFEAAKAPVDIYGVGTFLVQNHVGYTGDLVKLNGKPQAKEGRFELPSDRLKEVKLSPNSL